MMCKLCLESGFVVAQTVLVVTDQTICHVIIYYVTKCTYRKLNETRGFRKKNHIESYVFACYRL